MWLSLTTRRLSFHKNENKMETKKRSMCLRPLQKLESMNICICITKEGERECEAKPREKGNEIGNDVDKGQRSPQSFSSDESES